MYVALGMGRTRYDIYGHFGMLVTDGEDFISGNMSCAQPLVIGL